MEKYSLIKKLGTGSSSTVSLYNHNSSKTLHAIKTIKRPKTSPIIKRELKALQKLRGCQNIITLTEFIEEGKNFHIVLEYAGDGNLEDYLKNHENIPFSHKISLIIDAVRAVYELHSFRLIHRDLKTSNFLLNAGILKLADFGISTKHSRNDLTFCGTPFYMAPEMFESAKYNSKVDIWALGIICFEILTGIHPFIANDIEELIRNIHMKVNMNGLGHHEIEFLTMALQVKPELRPGIEKLIKCKLITRYLNKIFNGLEQLLKFLESFQSNDTFLYARFAVLCYLIKDVLYFKCKTYLKECLKTTAEKLQLRSIDEYYWKVIIEQAESILTIIGQKNVFMSNMLLFVLKRLKSFMVFDCFNDCLLM